MPECDPGTSCSVSSSAPADPSSVIPHPDCHKRSKAVLHRADVLTVSFSESQQKTKGNRMQHPTKQHSEAVNHVQNPEACSQQETVSHM